MSLSMQEIFYVYEIDTELVSELNFEISEVTAEKGKAYSDDEFIKNCLELFSRSVFPEKNCVVNSDGFNRVLTVRPHQAPLKYIKKWPPYTRYYSICL